MHVQSALPRDARDEKIFQMSERWAFARPWYDEHPTAAKAS